MTFELPPLPFAQDALAPTMSAETLDYHYGKHHKAYVDNLNKALPGSAFEGKSLEEIIRTADGPVFNNAAQIWNHTFFWNSLTPSSGSPSAALKGAIDKAFGSLDQFKKDFAAKAAANFGSGWTWLVKNKDGSVAIVNTSNAQTPLTDAAVTPLLTVDVWEHAYYIDYRNARPKYLEAVWNIVNWKFASDNFGG